MRVVSCALSLVVSACYAPNPPAGAPCSGPTSCPAGQTCTDTSGGMFCLTNDMVIADAAPDGVIIPIDATDATTSIDAQSCFGSGLVHLCFATLPTTSLTIGLPTSIDTATDARCMTFVQPSGPPLCVVAATSITIGIAGVIIAVGSNPLVLFATDSLTVNGGIDVASHHLGGAGAGARATCGNGTNGAPGLILGGGGGGAGGGLGTVGANGGGGFNGIPGGVALPMLATQGLTGGCPGGNGGAGMGGGEGLGAAGGGAVYLLAGTSISVAGRIDASGAGGAFGSFVTSTSGGAGGGGSGGMIGLEAPAISVTGAIFASGGGGGGGGGTTTGHGTNGGEALTATGAVNGGTGGTSGGNGGAGFSQGVAAGPGTAGTAVFSAGGGGGGGAGIIRMFPLGATGGTISPPAS